MALRYYMDVHIPVAITEGLRRRGVDVLTSQEDGTREAEDEVLFERAIDLGRILVSQDEDLLAIATGWNQSGRPFPGVIFAPQRGTSIGGCVLDLELVAECLRPDEAANRITYLPLG